MKITQKLKFALRALLLKMGRVSTDKGELIFDAEELAVGMEVFVEKTEGEEIEYVPAEDGEYAYDGKTIVVADGKVSEIREPEEEPQDESVEAEEVLEPADEPADAEETESETVEQRLERLEGRLAEFTEGLEKILNAVAGLEERLAAAEEKLSKIADEPAEEPLEEEMEENEPQGRIKYFKKK